MMKFKNTANATELRALWQEAFGDSDDYLDLFFSTAYSEKRSMAAFSDNELAGALYWFDCELGGKKVAYIYAVATAKRHRGKGVCAALMDYTNGYLINNGYSLAILVPSKASLFGFYQKIGYKTCGYIKEIKVKGCAEKSAINEISCEEYSALRKDFLPENAVILNQENTEFLKAQYRFFKGEDFIYCESKLDSSFLPEFLGNTEKIPQKNKTTFARTVGNGKPFLMGISLEESPLRDNIYFPFAFD